LDGKFFAKARENTDKNEEDPGEDGMFLKLINCVAKVCPKLQQLKFQINDLEHEWGEGEFSEAVEGCAKALSKYKSKFGISVCLRLIY
jgi:hypothetical protein